MLLVSRTQTKAVWVRDTRMALPTTTHKGRQVTIPLHTHIVHTHALFKMLTYVYMSVHAQAQTVHANMGINMHYTPDKTYK